MPPSSQMNRTSMTIATVSVVVLGGWAMSAQDKYSVKVPGRLAFSEFKGYEGWQAISMSRRDKTVAITRGNPVMIDAYRTGIPANGNQFASEYLTAHHPGERYYARQLERRPDR